MRSIFRHAWVMGFIGLSACPPPNAECGNSVVEDGEQCDPPGVGACDALCQLPPANCGDGVVQGNEGEECDDANQTNADGCDNNCTNTGCGNGIPTPGEQCDDGNNSDGDGCSANCTIEGNAVCGNGFVETGETCDDGDTTSGDGCSSVCAIEPAPFDTNCPRLVDLPKFCVPLPNSGNVLTEVAPTQACGAGFFPTGGASLQSFVVRKLFDDTILIKETNSSTGEIPVMVLFLGDTKALLFDTGHVTGEVPNVIQPFLNGLPVELINTHLHGDHINNNSAFDTIAIDTPEVRTHCNINANSFDANQSAVCGNINNYDPPNGQTLNDPETFKVVRVARDGHRIDLGGRIITVLFTPGHSQTSVTLHDTGRRALYTGDTLYPDDEIPLVHPGGSNGAEYLATALRYEALEPQIDVVVGAHSQGTMPARVLGLFSQIVQDNANGGNQDQVVDNTCDAGGFSFINFP